MAKTHYCWRCDAEITMLDEQEREQVSPHLASDFREIKEYRQIHGVTLHEAKRYVQGRAALERDFEITGFRETNVEAIWHHRLRRFGPPCPSCDKLLRTARAKLCAACGIAIQL